MWSVQTPWFDVAVLVGLFHVGSLLFGHFEQHKPAWRRMLKAAIFVALLLALEYAAWRWWAYGVFALLFCGAGSFHFWWLSKHGINGWTGEPRERFLALVKRSQR